ncbi:uncharacterized protein DEA37_0006410 [Paragonimus westermani]|uniref:Uncharacterized protein n=1 Tax=Paragonimus westermani TaxID=34504 RepID=A0A5J4NUV2_9TREM|nr:uncharacterized protein DEA37_0006410 [Paragonimus westermani]
MPRCVSPGTSTTMTVGLHSFFDASEIEYRAVGYLRVTASNGSVKCCRMLGKSRVSPRKIVTILGL